jgi:hypothetical protein
MSASGRVQPYHGTMEFQSLKLAPRPLELLLQRLYPLLDAV